MGNTLNALLSANRSSSRMIAGMNSRSRLPVGLLIAYILCVPGFALAFWTVCPGGRVKWFAFDEEEEHASRQFNRRHS